MIVLNASHNIYCWGDNTEGLLGLGNNEVIDEIIENEILSQLNVKDICF
jgi:hypothetical protein